MKKVASILGNVLTVLILVFSVVMTTLVITSTRSESGLPSLFGYSLFSVQTDSMESKDGFYVGDLIVIRNLSEDEANNLHVGDVITFWRTYQDQNYLESHRIVEDTVTDKPNEMVDGIWLHGEYRNYVTRGDNTPDIDYTEHIGEDGKFIPDYTNALKIVGIWEGVRLPHIGSAIDFLKSQLGFMLFIVIPIALFFIYELYVFIMTLTRRQKEKAIAEVADKEAELKAKAVAEFLAQQQANGGGTTPPAENTAPAVPVAETPAEPAKPVDAADVSEEEKQRIIQEYLAKQQKKDGE